ncbi:MAG TPA: endonuclease/exonuclease/phosphatase family protein [Patescibacteria group bacterium]|jgi:endonuclease/exonuclease/phosphatase family metal-dependent hydrolase|nr:endonuclease/exonuclease/phosphatase family protein [Patescibacteria group bacterium]
MISVLAYNIQYGRKLDLIERWLLKDPDKFDVICLQEFPFNESAKFLEAFAKHSFDYRFAPSISGKNKLYGELTLYKKRKLKLIDEKIVRLGTNLLETRFRRKGQRTSLLTVLGYKSKKIVLANSHLVCFALNSRRINQISKIIKNIKVIGDHSAFSTVILGDFNYTSRIRQKKLIEFMEKNELTNAYKTHTHKLFFIKQQLDYVFYNNCVIKNVKIGKKVKYSDHSPVWFDIDFDK